MDQLTESLKGVGTSMSLEYVPRKEYKNNADNVKERIKDMGE